MYGATMKKFSQQHMFKPKQWNTEAGVAGSQIKLSTLKNASQIYKSLGEIKRSINEANEWNTGNIDQKKKVNKGRVFCDTQGLCPASNLIFRCTY